MKYYWRDLNDEQRAEVLRQRKGRKLPWHSPPHRDFEGPKSFLVTTACYEHRPVIGKSPGRMADFEEQLLGACQALCLAIFAWCILPNHYHILLRTSSIEELRKELGRLHGRTSFSWNREDEQVGRKVWFNFFDRDMYAIYPPPASINYIHNNAVHHGYVQRWQDWPYSSAARFIEEVGREEATRIWKSIRCSTMEKIGILFKASKFVQSSSFSLSVVQSSSFSLFCAATVILGNG